MAGKLKLCEPLTRGVVHRSTAIEHKVDAEVCLVLVALDEVPVCAREYTPVDVFGFIAYAVAFMVGKFGTRTSQRTAVRARKVSLDLVA
jgi:hypothetical protein